MKCFRIIVVCEVSEQGRENKIYVVHVYVTKMKRNIKMNSNSCFPS